MGILRLYLALCVVADHGGPVFPWRMHNGSQAVQMFYIISGFYMALVLSTRYSKPRDFYLSRFLRIFPPYWIALAATVVLSLFAGLAFNRWLMLRTYINHPFEHNGTAGVLLAVLFNLTVIGQDWIMFLKHDLGQSLQFTANCWNDPSPLWRFLVIPQSWTIGVELTFYAFAPYLNRLRSKWLICIAAGAFAARLIAYRHLGLAHDPWEYRFFPFELSLFLCGMLGYRFYAQISSRQGLLRWQTASWSSYLLGAAALLLLLYFHVCTVQFLGTIIDPHIAVLITYPLFILGIPLLFLASGKHKFDRLIGELSYPIYLIHYLVIVVLANLLAIGPGAKLGGLAAVSSIVIAAVFYRVFITRLDTKRLDLSTKSRQSGKTTDAAAGSSAA
jgi:peptidoglycan/LPS O-acetylase OafA/YrhL